MTMIRRFPRHSLDLLPIAGKLGIQLDEIEQVVIAVQTKSGLHLISTLCCDEHTATGLARIAGQLLLRIKQSEAEQHVSENGHST